MFAWIERLKLCTLAAALVPMYALHAAPPAPMVVPAAPAVAALAYLVQDYES